MNNLKLILTESNSNIFFLYFLLFIMIILGIINIVFPAKMVKFRHIFEFKNDPEPSDFAIVMTRLSGILLIIMAIIIILTI